MMLAQLSIDMVKYTPHFLVSLGACVWIYNQIKEATHRDVPEPPNSSLHLSHQSLVGRVDDVENEVGKIQAELRADRLRVDENARSRSAGLYNKIDEVRKELHHATTEQTTALTNKIEDIQKDMPSRIIALLRNTGVIK